MLTLDKFEEASEKVKEVTLETKLVYSDFLSEQTGNKVYLKPENMQFTGAYKVRGAYYKISTLTETERKKGLITASAGNHAQGVAYAEMFTTRPVRKPTNWQRKKDIRSFIRSMILQLQPDRERSQWKSLKSCRLWNIF